MTAIKTKPFAVTAAIKGTATAAADDLGKLEALLNQVKAILTADDVSLDTIQEVITRIKSDEGLIASLTTGKVNVASIVNDLTTGGATVPASAETVKVLNAKLDSSILIVYSKVEADGITDDFDTLQNEVTAMGGKGILFLPKGVIYLNKLKAGGVKLPANATGITILGQGKEATTFKLSKNVPRLFDAVYGGSPTASILYKNITLAGFSVDANNIDGSAIAAPYTFTAGQTLTTSWNDVEVGDNTQFASATTVYFPATNGGTVKDKSMAARLKTGSSTAIQVRNDTGGSLTILTGDVVKGSSVNHVVFGTLYDAYTTPNWNINFDNILIKDINTFNVPTEGAEGLGTRMSTSRANVILNSELSSSYTGTLYSTNIRVSNCNFSGGAFGVCIAFNGKTPQNSYLNEVHIDNCQHTTNLLPTSNYTSANFFIGGSGYGNKCSIKNCWGEFSGDVGVEIDAMLNGVVEDCVMEDAFGGGYFTTNYNIPAKVMGGQLTTTILNGGNGITSGSSSLVVASIPANTPNFGYLAVDNELMWYNRSYNSNTLSVFRAMNITTAAAHADGAKVTFINPEKQTIQFNKCVYRNRRLGAGSGPGFYQYRNYFLPQPQLKLRDCLYDRQGDDLTMVGESIQIEGINRSIDVDGFTINISGINQTASTGVKGSAMRFYRAGNRYDTFSNVFPDKIKLKNIEINTSGNLGTVVTRPVFSHIKVERGYWQVNFDNIQISTKLDNTVSNQVTGIDFTTDPSSVVGGKIANYTFRSITGDNAPNGISIPSTSFCTIRQLSITGVDYHHMQFSANAGNTNYKPFVVDATNIGAVFIEDVRHSALVTGTLPRNYTHNEGTSTQSGTGALTSFTIAHGLGVIPSYYHVSAGSADAANILYSTVDATNITVVYQTAPITGTNNLKLAWEVTK